MPAPGEETDPTPLATVATEECMGLGVVEQGQLTLPRTAGAREQVQRTVSEQRVGVSRSWPG